MPPSRQPCEVSRNDRAISILEREGAPRPGVTQDLAAREGLIPRLGPGLTPPCFFCPHFGPDVMLTGRITPASGTLTCGGGRGGGDGGI